jgi:hypothetical protein
MGHLNSLESEIDRDRSRQCRARDCFFFAEQSADQMARRRYQLISIGCAMAAVGELHFELFGFLCQSAAVAVSQTLRVP